MVVKQVKLKVLDERIRLVIPVRSTEGSAGVDLRACLDHPLTIPAGECKLIGTGIAIHIDDPGLAGIIVPRSGLGHRHGIILGNSVGVIDSDYQGELKVSCWNRSSKDYDINPKERIAQLLIIPVVHAQFNVVESFDETERGSGGFGHTGRD